MAQDIRVIVAPAKRMSGDADDFAPAGLPAFADEACLLVERLKAMEFGELQALWGCSDSLARTAYNALQAWDPVRDSAPAVMSYVGIQYQHMAPQVMPDEALAWLQGHLRIVSGLYGLLLPFDGVAPYRLEMQAKLPMPCRVTAPGLVDHAAPARNLYEFWGGALARELERADVDEPRGPIHVVNLASAEYADAVLPHLGDTPVTTCMFLEPRRDGKLVQRATASKTARGTMVRWMAERQVSDIGDLRVFDLGGYAFDPGRSDERVFAFVKGGAV